MPALSDVDPAPNLRLERIDYSAPSRTLTILASDGVVYQHQRVPQRVYDRLLAETAPADQAEYYFHHIRGRYPLVKIRDARGN